jgi:maleylpyruvate isomerase
MTADPRPYADLLTEATQRLIRTVDSFHGDDWTAPSGLPGWTRAHVVAHLTLNAEGLAHSLSTLVGDEPGSPMYASQEARDRDIAELAGGEHEALRERLLAGCAHFGDAFSALPEDRWSAEIERVPGGRTFPAKDAVLMRLREVEIHHVDLDAGYSTAEWSRPFLSMLLQTMSAREWPTPFQVEPTDLDDHFSCGGEGGPTVTGSAADLGWWLTGRGSGEGVSSSDGTLPEVEAW